MKTIFVAFSNTQGFEKDLYALATKKESFGRNFLVIKNGGFKKVGLVGYIVHCFKQALKFKRPLQSEEELKSSVELFLGTGIGHLDPSQLKSEKGALKGAIKQLAKRGRLDKNKVDQFIQRIESRYQETMQQALQGSKERKEATATEEPKDTQDEA